jgi:hypothetical protein
MIHGKKNSIISMLDKIGEANHDPKLINISLVYSMHAWCSLCCKWCRDTVGTALLVVGGLGPSYWSFVSSVRANT